MLAYIGAYFAVTAWHAHHFPAAVIAHAEKNNIPDPKKYARLEPWRCLLCGWVTVLLAYTLNG